MKQYLNRRSLLHQTLLTTAGIMVKSQADNRNTAPAEFVPPQPCPSTSWHKHGVILEATEPWEGSRIQNFTSPTEPLDKNRWRIWYSGRGSPGKLAIGFAEGIPGSVMKKFPLQCSQSALSHAPFTLSKLPDKWNPTQVIHLQLRNGKHRIYFWAHGPEILRFLAADSIDGRNYRVINPHRPVLYHPNDRAAQGIPSPDGALLRKNRSESRPVHEPLASPNLISNDATNVYQLTDGSFEMYSVARVPVAKNDPAYISHDNAAGFIRVVDRYTSQDGLHFGNRKRVIQRDEKDPIDQQFYYLAVTYTPKGRVGMLGHYRVQAQTMDLEWCFSTDGLKWHRPHRTAWITRGDKTQPDSYGIYAPNQLVYDQGKYHLFYTAVNSAHNHKHSYGPPRSVVMYATTKSIWA